MADEPQIPTEEDLREALDTIGVADILVNALSAVASIGFHRVAPGARDLEQARLIGLNGRIVLPCGATLPARHDLICDHPHWHSILGAGSEVEGQGRRRRRDASERLSEPQIAGQRLEYVLPRQYGRRIAHDQRLLL